MPVHGGRLQPIMRAVPYSAVLVILHSVSRGGGEDETAVVGNTQPSERGMRLQQTGTVGRQSALEAPQAIRNTQHAPFFLGVQTVTLDLGVIQSIARYPVKSMPGETLEEVALGFQGVPGDRRYAFVQQEAKGQFPWLTGREAHDMMRYRTVWDSSGARPRVLVTTPEGQSYAVDSDELCADIAARGGRPVYLLADHRGNYDIAHVSLIAVPTIERLCEQAAVPVDHRRFRMNLMVDTGGPPFVEADWIGKVLRIGDTARIAITEPDGRCAMITLDPDSGAQLPAVLRATAELNGNNAGVYATVLTPGPVRVGDRVVVSSE